MWPTNLHHFEASSTIGILLKNLSRFHNRGSSGADNYLSFREIKFSNIFRWKKKKGDIGRLQKFQFSSFFRMGHKHSVDKIVWDEIFW